MEKQEKVTRIEVKAIPKEEEIVVHIGSLALIEAPDHQIVKKVPFGKINAIRYVDGKPEYSQEELVA